MSQYLSEAFKRLDTLNEDTFQVSTSGLEDFAKFTDEDEFEDIVDVIDPEAETEEDLEDSYVGKVILDCCVCHSKLYKDVEDVVIEDDIANAGEECPFCYTPDGYKVIGQVAEFGEEETKEDTEEKEDKAEEKDDVNEGLFGIKTKKEKEKEAKAKAEKERQKQRDKELKDQEERARQQSVADSWARRDRAERDAQREYNRSSTSSQSSKVSNTGKAGVYYSGGDYYTESKSIKESVNNVNVETDEDVINVATDDNGKVTVTTEPKATTVESEEVITPIEPEVQAEISDNVADGEEIEIDMDEFDEESFDELGEGYLKEVYENVKSFKTSNVSLVKDKLVLEGVIKFDSGKSKKTNFVFGIREATKSGKVRFIGENKEIARGKKSFTVTGRVEDKKFLSESFNYNYGVRNAQGKAQRLYGTIKRG